VQEIGKEKILQEVISDLELYRIFLKQLLSQEKLTDKNQNNYFNKFYLTLKKLTYMFKTKDAWMNFFYSFGAAIVILGAWLKITHITWDQLTVIWLLQ
jgi:hypothetical protein